MINGTGAVNPSIKLTRQIIKAHILLQYIQQMILQTGFTALQSSSMVSGIHLVTFI